MRSLLTRRALFLFAALAPGFAPVAIPGELFVGANYHPHDSNPEAWARDIKLMQAGGFRVVRMGHLAWNSYEPRRHAYRQGAGDSRW